MNALKLRVSNEFEAEIIIRKSKFIATVYPVSDAQEAENILRTVRKRYSDATHRCYAYSIDGSNGIEQRFSDDGEPQGTAGVPILEVLKKCNVFQTLIVVTRYFGGIKLGASGLIGAYTESACAALKGAALLRIESSAVCKCRFDYVWTQKVSETICRFGGSILDIVYVEDVTLEYAIPLRDDSALSQTLTELTNGKISFVERAEKIIDYPFSDLTEVL